MTAVSIVAGVALLVIALNDVFHTLLRPASTGRLTTSIFRMFWWLSRRRRRTLTASGALTVVATIAVWIALVALGWALIYLPYQPDGFSYSGVDPAAYHPFHEALTYSLVALTTLGLGDVVPLDPLIRLLSPLEALTGFILLSAAVSWSMQLYPALARRRAVAIELTSLHAARVGDLADQELSPAYAASVIGSVTRALVQSTADLVQNTEIFYFTERDDRLSAPRAIQYAVELRDAALRASAADVRVAGEVLGHVMDELAWVLTAQYPHIRGETTDEVLAAVADSHGHTTP